MNDGDIGRGEIDAGVELGDSRIVPLRNLPEIDVREHLTGELELGIDARDVVDGDNTTENRREMENFSGRRLQLLVRHRAVARAEKDGAIRDLADTAARSDWL